MTAKTKRAQRKTEPHVGAGLKPAPTINFEIPEH